MAREVVGIERVALLRPIRQDLDQLTLRQHWGETKLDGLRDAVAGSAGGEFGREFVEHEPAACLHLNDLSGAMELPGKRATAAGITEQKAFCTNAFCGDHGTEGIRAARDRAGAAADRGGPDRRVTHS